MTDTNREPPLPPTPDLTGCGPERAYIRGSMDAVKAMEAALDFAATMKRTAETISRNTSGTGPKPTSGWQGGSDREDDEARPGTNHLSATGQMKAAGTSPQDDLPNRRFRNPPHTCPYYESGVVGRIDQINGRNGDYASTEQVNTALYLPNCVIVTEAEAQRLLALKDVEEARAKLAEAEERLAGLDD